MQRNAGGYRWLALLYEHERLVSFDSVCSHWCQRLGMLEACQAGSSGVVVLVLPLFGLLVLWDRKWRQPICLLAMSGGASPPLLFVPSLSAFYLLQLLLRRPAGLLRPSCFPISFSVCFLETTAVVGSGLAPFFLLILSPVTLLQLAAALPSIRPLLVVT